MLKILRYYKINSMNLSEINLFSLNVKQKKKMSDKQSLSKQGS